MRKLEFARPISPAAQSALPSFIAVDSFWTQHERYCVALPDPYKIRHREVVRHLQRLQALRPPALALEEAGRSYEGREILTATIGTGPRKILAWTQMHGDEPTHTAVLLDLFNYLLQTAEDLPAAAILSGCTLRAIMMLNPDGAERNMRYNAQGIDINRDALALASPEARLLREQVRSFAPDFALNLHNHNPRRTVGDTRRAAAAALLTPPVDAQATEVPQVRLAKQVAGCFLRTAAEVAPEMTARYRAEYMPRAFGEWIQQQGPATLLIEAGGWSGLGAAPIRQFHFAGLAATLAAVARDEHLNSDAAAYNSLPLTGESDLFDLLIQNAAIRDGRGRPTFPADLGVNGPTRDLQAAPWLSGGKISEIGDLRTAGGKTTLDIGGSICQRGRVELDASLSPCKLPSADVAAQAVSRGVTTLVGVVHLTRSDEVQAFLQLPWQLDAPVNVGFVAATDCWPPDHPERLEAVAARGILALVADGPVDEQPAVLSGAPLPRLSRAKLAADGLHSVVRAGRLDIVARDADADLAIFAAAGAPPSHGAASLNSDNLRHVVVGGTVVYSKQQFIDAPVGRLVANA